MCAVLAVLLLACDGGSKDDAAPKVTPTPRLAGQTASTSAAAPTPAVTRVSDEPVAFQTDDGVTVRGHLYSTPGPIRRVVILAHMSTNDQRAWQPYARDLAAGGIAAMTLDFRGFGETGGQKDVSLIDRDLSSALLFLKSRDYPLTYLVGAEMGGTAALKVAAAQDVAGVIAVSAPVSFQGLSAQPDVARITERKLFLASSADPEGAAQALLQLLQLAVEPKESFVFEGRARGTELLEGSSGAVFKQKVLEFLQR